MGHEEAVYLLIRANANIMDRTLQTLGKYQIIEELGRGAHATVYKARDTTLDRVVALKVMRPGLLWEPDAVERFMREARAAAQLEHPHIVTIYEVGETEGTYYIAMRYLPGATVDELIERGPMPVEQAVDIARQVAEALGYGHQRGFIHRDVKPSNIIVSDDGFATLTDFGLVKALAWASLTSSGGVMGTPGYVAPELWEEKGASPATDVYALGVVLWEMLAGRRLFAGETPAGVMRKHLTETPPPLTEVRAGVPRAVADVVARALEKVPEDRYQGGTDLARALEHPVRKEAVAEAPISTGTRVRTPQVIPQQWLVPRFAVYAATFLVILVFVAWLAIRPTGPPMPTTTPTATRTPALTATATGRTVVPVASPTPTPFPTPTHTPKPSSTPHAEITVGSYVTVVGAGADGVSYKSGPGLNYARLGLLKDGTILKVLEGPEEADGYTWWRLEDEDGFTGWVADNWLEPATAPLSKITIGGYVCEGGRC